jgi:hypothetical protein
MKYAGSEARNIAVLFLLAAVTASNQIQTKLHRPIARSLILQTSATNWIFLKEARKTSPSK